MKISFNNWLTQVGKSKKTAVNYSRAVSGKISEWARDAGLCTANLEDVHSLEELATVAEGLKDIAIYQERNPHR